MTSEEIKNTYFHDEDLTLKEIAYQLAIFNERNARLDSEQSKPGQGMPSLTLEERAVLIRMDSASRSVEGSVGQDPTFCME